MAEAQVSVAQAQCSLPRITIKFCTQCKWMLRAAYFAQELLSTFSLAIGEVALQPSTGGVFTVTITHRGGGGGAEEHQGQQQQQQQQEEDTLLWDRKTEGGFPEVKELKRRVRDVIEPGRDLGHVDRHGGRTAAGETAREAGTGQEKKAAEVECEDCK